MIPPNVFRTEQVSTLLYLLRTELVKGVNVKMQKLSQRLHELRKEKALSQQQVADAVDIGFSTYRRYENGQREPDASTLVRMADFYDVTADYLLGRSDERK